MPFSHWDHRAVYYYVICVIAFFVFFWGAIDLASSSIGLTAMRGGTATYSAPQGGEEIMPPEKGEQLFDAYYQKKMLFDRFWDSLIRVVLGGIVFAYARTRVNQLEGKA